VTGETNMSIKHDLQHSINRLFKSRQNSYATHYERRHILNRFAADLVSIGYGLRNIDGLKQKHILAIVKFWQEKGLAIATIKNRMAALRRLCEKINKKNLIPSNAQLNIGRRTYVPKRNRAIFNPDFSMIRNKHVRVSLELQRVFGLRREECLKIKPHLADKDNRLELLPTWYKGGRSRIIPIRTDEQRYWLEQVKLVAGKFGDSLIPQEKNYIQHRYIYEKQVSRAGLKNLHGLRHAYAQQRYKELTGWEAPINGGPKSRELTPEQKEIDYQARMILSGELGHGREQITVNYCGR
jgi:site-specific recombinase XerD